MKKILTILCSVPILALAQDCKNYLFMTDNAQIQMTVYDKKGKESGIVTWKISNVKKSNNGAESTVNSTFKDEKGKEISNSKGIYKCDNGILKADVRMSIPQESLQAYKDAEAKFDSVYLEYPANISVGQTLKDADFKMDLQSKGGLSTTVTFKEVNRKVSNKESTTTPAGTWEAYVIDFETTFKMQIAGIGIPINLMGKEWFVPNVGVVKSETYSKGGKLVGSTVLSSIIK